MRTADRHVAGRGGSMGDATQLTVFLILLGAAAPGARSVTEASDAPSRAALRARTVLRESAWSAFTAPDDRVSVQFPNRPTSASETLDTAAGRVEWVQHSCSVGGHSFHLNWCDMPAALDHAALKSTIMTVAAKHDGLIYREAVADVAGFPGVIAGWSDKTFTSEARVVCVGRRQYQLIVVSTRSLFDCEAAGRFLNSFALTNPDEERRGADEQLRDDTKRKRGVEASTLAAIERAFQASPTPTWLQPPAAGFRVWMPAGAESSMVEFLPGVEASVHVAVGRTARCMVFAYGGGVASDEADARGRLSRGSEMFLTAFGLTLSSRTPTQVHGRPAVIAKASGSGMHAELLGTMDGSRMFLVLAVVGEPGCDDGELRRFLDSFELVAAVQTEAP